VRFHRLFSEISLIFQWQGGHRIIVSEIPLVLASVDHDAEVSVRSEENTRNEYKHLKD